MLYYQTNTETTMVPFAWREKLVRKNPQDLVYSELPVEEHTEETLSGIQYALAETGVVYPVLIDNDCQIVAGQGFAKVAKQIELEEIPTLNLEDMSLDEQLAYIELVRHYCETTELDFKIQCIEVQHIFYLAICELAAIELYGPYSFPPILIV